MRYKGEKCPVCDNIFTDNDDVVVCPDCGTPHHRECYSKAGKCANEEKHSGKFVWRAEKSKAGNEEKKTAFCPYCNSILEQDAEECPKCGKTLKSIGTRNENGIVTKAFPVIFGVEHDKDIKGAKAWELVYFVSKNPRYYLSLFNLFAETGKKISFNLICFIFPPVFFAYRRMWWWALLTALIGVIIALPVTIAGFADAGMYSGTMTLFSKSVTEMLHNNAAFLEKLIDICNVLEFAERILLCLFGNYIYYRYATKAIGYIRKLKNGISPTIDDLQEYGGVRVSNVFFIVLVSFAFSVIAIAGAQVFLERMV